MTPFLGPEEIAVNDRLEREERERRDGRIKLANMTASLAGRLLQLLPRDCPNNGGLMIEGTGARIDAGELRALLRECDAVRRCEP